MNYKRVYFTILAISLFQTMSYTQAQTINLMGYVKDSFTYQAIDGVKVSLLTADSVVVADSLLSLPMGTDGTVYVAHNRPRTRHRVLIRATHPDYETAYLAYEVKNTGRLRQLRLPDIMMRRVWRKELDEVVVSATKVKMVMRGDTIVYDATAFSLPSGSMLDALIRQLPGAELRANGEILINGKKIDYLMLNSKEFFRGNNRVMLDNLPYYTVKEVKVYEKNTDLNNFLGREAEKKDFVMDVGLKREYSTGYLGNTDIGGGTSERYAARMFGLRFTDYTRVSLFANLNNLNQSQAPGANAADGLQAVPRDLVANKHTGFDLYSEPKDKSWLEMLKVTARWSDQVSERSSWQQSFLSDGSSAYRRSTLSSDASSIDLMADQIFSRTMKRLYVYSRVMYEYSKRTDEGESSSLASSHEDFAGDTASHRLARNLTKGHTSELNSRVIATPRLSWGDELTFQTDGGFYRQRNRDYTKSVISNSVGTDFRHDYGTLGSDKRYLHAWAEYTIPMLSGMAWRFIYAPKFEHSERRDHIFRLDNLEGWNAASDKPLLVLPSVIDMMASCIDVVNTHDYSHGLATHSLRLGLDYSLSNKCGTKFGGKLMLPVDFINENAELQQGGKNARLHRTRTAFRPTCELSTAWRKEMSRAKMTFAMDMTHPDMQQMFAMTTNRDALNIREGNPDLRTTRVCSWRGELTHKMKSHAQMLGLSLSANSYHNLVSVGQTYDNKTGVYTFRPENVNGNWDAGAAANYTATLGTRRNLTFQGSLSGQLLHSVDFSAVADAASPLSKVNTRIVGNTMSLAYQQGDLNLKAATEMTWRTADAYEVSVTDSRLTLDGSYSLKATGTALQANLAIWNRQGYGDSLHDNTDFVLNAAISHPLLKNKLTARLEAFDLLHNLSSTQYTLNAQGRTITTHRCLPHYIMLHLIWMWNKNPKKK